VLEEGKKIGKKGDRRGHPPCQEQAPPIWDKECKRKNLCGYGKGKISLIRAKARGRRGRRYIFPVQAVNLPNEKAMEERKQKSYISGSRYMKDPRREKASARKKPKNNWKGREVREPRG